MTVRQCPTLGNVGGQNPVGTRENRTPNRVAAGCLPGDRRLCPERASVSELVHKDIAINVRGLVVTLGERDQGVNVTVNEAPQMEAPHLTFNAQKFADKYDVGSNGDKVGKKGLPC